MNDIIRIFKYYFLGRQDIFDEQLPKGGYRQVNRRISNKDLETHLAYKKTYATRLLSYKTRLSGHTVIHIANSEVSALNRLMDGASDAGLYSNQMVPEYTGGLGYRLWLRYLYPIEADMATTMGELILKLSKMAGQVFPERDTRSENILTLPLSIDREYGQRSYIFDAGLNPVENWAAYLRTVQPITPQEAGCIVRAYKNPNRN